MIAAAVLGVYLLGWNGLHLPNPQLTPGKTVAITTTEVCATTWGRDVRHVTQRMKVEVCQRYGAHQCPGPKWEVDHLVPRELGGADHVDNLWPQMIAEARLKDRLENFLHRAVCNGFLSLEEAQQGIRTDWTQQYRLMRDEQ